jgi:glutathione S-transferase
MTTGARYRLHGLKLSYFTGKLEAYFRAKGVPFDYIEMDLADFRRCARATGIAQMPQVEMPSGAWMTDTTDIIAHFEAEAAEPRIKPADPGIAFISLLLEDLFDEWLWRPALYHRWAFAEDARLMSSQLARTMLRDAPAPLFLRRQFILRRQRRTFLTKDGVTATTAPQIEHLYLRTLAILEPIFAVRPYLFGGRPCEADFGLFGPFFRHFSSDPTPAAILRERAPHTLAWVSRLWAATPAQLAASPDTTEAPSDLDPLVAMACEEYLPYLASNSDATRAGKNEVRWTNFGVAWRTPASPYRARCLASLQRAYQALDATAVSTIAARLTPGAASLLAKPITPSVTPTTPSTKPRDRNWR